MAIALDTYNAIVEANIMATSRVINFEIRKFAASAVWKI